MSRERPEIHTPFVARRGALGSAARCERPRVLRRTGGHLRVRRRDEPTRCGSGRQSRHRGAVRHGWHFPTTVRKNPEKPEIDRQPTRAVPVGRSRSAHAPCFTRSHAQTPVISRCQSQSLRRLASENAACRGPTTATDGPGDQARADGLVCIVVRLTDFARNNPVTDATVLSCHQPPPGVLTSWRLFLSSLGVSS